MKGLEQKLIAITVVVVGAIYLYQYWLGNFELNVVLQDIAGNLAAFIVGGIMTIIMFKVNRGKKK